MMTHVLRIKFRTPILVRQHSREASGHLAVRLNECKTFDETAFFKLVEYVSCIFSVKYLTIILADNQSNLSFNIDASRCKVPFTLYSDFEPVNNLLDHSTQLSVNLIKSDSENIFLQKLKKFNDQDSVKPYPPDSLYSMALKSFTEFPSVDLFICFSRTLKFFHLYPLHLGFCQFYSCPILYDQAFSFEAISEGFDRFSRTKQNFGK